MQAVQKVFTSGPVQASFSKFYPWITSPFVISAPMRVLSGPHLAFAVSKAGSLGFIGPGAKPEDTAADLSTIQELLDNTTTGALSAYAQSQSKLPVGIGFQVWDGDLTTATRIVQRYNPCAAWLFAPKNGQKELDEWTYSLRHVSPGIQIWLQIGTVQESIDAAESAHPPDVLVVQGAEAGGHGRANDGMGLMSLFPEISDQCNGSNIALVAAGGIADGRGIAAALALGASGVAMGTRFLASTEARISKGYQQEIVRARDGASCTTRTLLYNHLRGTMGWPEHYSPRGIVNQSWHDHRAGTSFETLKERYEKAVASGDDGWGPSGRLATYAGASVGLIHGVEDTGSLVIRLQKEANEVLDKIGSV